MEHLIKEIEKSFCKINLLESFISLHLRRDRIEPQIQELADKTEEVKTLIEQCNHVMKVEYHSAMQEHKAIMRKMQEQQLQILNILTERQKSLKAEKSCRGILTERQPKSAQKGFLTIPGIQLIKGEVSTQLRV